jgi:hypothetical protein
MKSDYALLQAAPPPLRSKSRPEKWDAIRSGSICVSVFTMCLWVAWPIAEIGFDDDWSYIKSALALASTDHITYNGWSGAIVGWQLFWGDLFVHLLGSSFTAVRLSNFPIAVGVLLLFHAIQVRFGITGRNAIFGTLALGLSPLFLPLAASYMTDIPGLFVIMLCLYCCKRAIDADTSGRTIVWLCLAAASSTFGGIDRQIAWLGALVMVPATGWRLRGRRGVFLTIFVLWSGTISVVLYFMHWFNAQPYSIPAPLLPDTKMRPALLFITILIALLGMLLCLLLMLFPIFAAWLTQISKLKRNNLASIGMMLLMFLLLQLSARWNLPWTDNLISTEFSALRATDFGKPFPHLILGTSACLVLSLVVVGAFLVFLASFQPNMLKDPPPKAFLQEVLWIFGPFILCYFALLIPHASRGFASDRYMLDIMPFVIIFAVRLHQQWISPRIPTASILILGLYGLLAVAGTHDLFASQRARLAATDEIRASGAPRTEIVAGFEYDAWTQVEVAGYINNPRIKNPPDAYHPNLPLVPTIRPVYLVTAEPRQTLAPTSFPPVHFRAWLPPFHGTFYVQKISTTVR